MPNMFNILYNRYIQEIKRQQIVQYNKNHKQYLKRCGKNINPESEEIKQRNNYNYNEYQQRPIMSKQKHNLSEYSNQNLNNNTYESRNAQKKQEKREFNNNNYNFGNNNDNNRMIHNENVHQVKDEKMQIKSHQANKFQNSSNHNSQSQNYSNFSNHQSQLQANHFENSRANQIRFIKPVHNNQNKNQLPSEYPQEQEIILEQCPEGCGRKFNPKALQKHVKVCQKIFQQKRKPFKVDVVDDQAKKVANKISKHPEKQLKSKTQKIPKWKKQSQRLRRGLQATKQSKDEGSSETVPVQQQDDRIKCGGCGRKFNQLAAAKHIENCIKRTKHKK